MADAHVKNLLVEILVSNHDKLFPGYHFRPSAPRYFDLPASHATAGGTVPGGTASGRASRLSPSTSPLTFSPGAVKYTGVNNGQRPRNEAASARRHDFNAHLSSSDELYASSDSLDDILDSDKGKGDGLRSTSLPFLSAGSGFSRSSRPDRKSLKKPPPPPPQPGGRGASTRPGKSESFRTASSLSAGSSSPSYDRSKSPRVHELINSAFEPTSSSASFSSHDAQSPARPPTLPVKLRKASSSSSSPAAVALVGSPDGRRMPSGEDEPEMVVVRNGGKKPVVDENENDYEEIADPDQGHTQVGWLVGC